MSRQLQEALTQDGLVRGRRESSAFFGRLQHFVVFRLANCPQPSPWKTTADSGSFAVPLPALAAGGAGIGCAEGWRGESLVALETGANGCIRSCHAHDPSWQNWPALAFAVFNNIVPDFPLINKSFNLSYAGVDL